MATAKMDVTWVDASGGEFPSGHARTVSPDTIPKAEVPWSGTDPESRGAKGGRHFAILERIRGAGRAQTVELVAVDWSTGEETLLVSGASVDWLELDHSDRVLTATVFPSHGTAVTELWSGVAPR